MPIPSRVLAAGNSPLSTVNICGDTAAAVAGAGSSATDATQLSSVYNLVTTNPASGGVKLPPTEAGALVIVTNTDADTVAVYPATGSTIDGTTSVTIAQNKVRIFFAVSGTQWFSMLGA